MSTPRKLPKIIVIIGPTASGKSELAVKIAKYFNGEIVSADSRQIYRGMDIGTAKPLRGPISNFQFLISKQNQKRKSQIKSQLYHGIRHYLIDIKNPNEDYTVAEYKKDAIAAIRKILRKGKLPILVGGTGLYTKAIVDNLDIPAVAADAELRRKLRLEEKKYGLPHLFKKLVKLDPGAAYIIDPKNPRRVIRALEIAIKTGEPFSAQRKIGQPLFNTLLVGIKVPNNQLKKKIYARVDEMIESGLVTEVKNLVKKYGPDQKALRRGSVQAFDAIGYREIIEYLRGKISLEEAVRLIKTNTWRYAKRQMTWFRKDENINWLYNGKRIKELVGKFLNE